MTTSHSNNLKPPEWVRRIVTGFDGAGHSVIEADGPSPHVAFLNDAKSLVWVDLWRTNAAPRAKDGDGCGSPMQLAPPPKGTVVRVLQFPPEKELEGFVASDALSREDAASRSAFKGQENASHPLMHKTQTIDYAVVLRGEIWAILETGETLMHPGDVIIQRATSHSWANRSDEPCVILFVLVDAHED